MSGIALVWAANVKGLKPHTKIVLIQLADFHNKETGRCFPSARALADECEMDRATVFRHLLILEERGLISRHARGDSKGGRSSNEYELHLDIVLGASAKHKEKSQKATGGRVAESDGGSRTPATGVVAESDTNLNNEPGSEPHNPPYPPEGGGEDFETFWENVPRKVGRGQALRAYRAARKKADPQTILSGIRRYAKERAGKDQRYTAHPSTWLNGERWLDAPSPGNFHDNLERTIDAIRGPNCVDRAQPERLPAPIPNAGTPGRRLGLGTGPNDGGSDQQADAGWYRPRRLG